ncbi:hypothetical protein [Micrococcus luteus]|uniref:hypothetical protein n=1 Tax=Micrococcus luteus TaxID=1270 RepID=UPI0020CB9E3F|nr:hypothetical protein [Micrococcus luteus]UTT45686.1 hypothetical protein NMQ02_00085 [Micrococcus luteus]
MARKTLHDEIQHDGGANAFVARQAENLRHWAAPKVESTRAWSEVAAAYGLIGGSAAAEEGRRKAQDAKKEYGPVVERGARKAGEAVAHQYGLLAPAVAKGVDTVQDFLEHLQAQAQDAGHEVQQQFAAARKDAEKAAKKGRRRGGRKAKQLRRDGRQAAKGLRKDAKKAAKGARKDAAAAGGLTLAGLLATGLSALQEQGGKVAPQVQARLADAGDYAQRRKEEVLPVAAARLADGAAHARKTAHDVEVPDALEQALIKLTGDKAIVKRLRKGAEQYAGAAEKDLNRAAGRRASRSGGRAWIVAGMAAAAAGAGYALWRLTKPVQDPWTAPVPGPITANIPVVEANNPYAQQQKVVAEAGSAAAGQGVRVDTAASDPVAAANAKVLGVQPGQQR